MSKPSSTAEASTNIEEIHNTYSAILRYFSLKDTYKIIGERLSVKDRMEKIMRLMTSSDIVSFHKLFLKKKSLLKE